MRAKSHVNMINNTKQVVVHFSEFKGNVLLNCHATTFPLQFFNRAFYLWHYFVALLNSHASFKSRFMDLDISSVSNFVSNSLYLKTKKNVMSQL